MKIVSRNSGNPKVGIVELTGGLNGSGALELKNWLFNYIDKDRSKSNLLINLGRVTKIDGLGISILENFLSRGINFHLLSVRPEIRLMLKLAEKKDLLEKIYNKIDCKHATSIFAREILRKNNGTNNSIKKRRHHRVKTAFPGKFKYISAKNGNAKDSEILCNTRVLNLSELGLYASNIKAAELKKKKLVSRPILLGRKLDFELNVNGNHIETNAECIWKSEVDGNLSVGVSFLNIRYEYKRIISEYVYNLFIHS